MPKWKRFVDREPKIQHGEYFFLQTARNELAIAIAAATNAGVLQPPPALPPAPPPALPVARRTRGNGNGAGGKSPEVVGAPAALPTAQPAASPDSAAQAQTITVRGPPGQRALSGRSVTTSDGKLLRSLFRRASAWLTS